MATSVQSITCAREHLGRNIGADHQARRHATPGQAIDACAYDQWTGRWSRLFVASLLAAAGVADGHRVLDAMHGMCPLPRMGKLCRSRMVSSIR
jgi:hypothetical protein